VTPERIRIARVITRLNVGGPAIQALLLTARLDARRFSSVLLAGRTGEREGDMAELRPVNGVRPILLPDLRREISPAHDLRALVVLFRRFRALRPHVVHTHLAKAGTLGRIAALLARVPVIVHTFHGNVLSSYFGGPTSAAFTRVERMLARATTRVIAISPTQAAELERRRIGARRIEMVPLGVDLSAFRDARAGAYRAEIGADAVPLVGIVARLVPIKRVDLFLVAAARIAERVPVARFVVVGDGPMRATLERRCAELGLASRVRFDGWRADVASVYADLDVLVCCSDNEGTPVSVIEAMATGTPVVATAVGGVPDVVRGGEGVLVPSGDPAALAGAVSRLLEDPVGRGDLGRRGRERILREHDASALVSRIEDLYARLLRERGIAVADR
jgi:glycosyltransferase involved in cell wall biosynthesis